MSKTIRKTPRPSHPPELRCIFRMELRGNSVWRVGIRRSHPPREFQKYFFDHTHGGPKAALAAARAWRDEIEAKHPRASKQELASLVRKHNTTGIPGVYRRVMHRTMKNGRVKTHTVWQAQTPLSAVPFRSRSFSVLKFGEDEAKRLAIEARKVFESELDKA